MPLGTEVGLSLGDFVLDGDPAPALNFRPMFIIVIVISPQIRSAPQIRSTILALYKLVCMYVCMYVRQCTVVIGLFKFKFKF